jgi:FlaA1/EpsC-like NDP-sugar epimerase
MWRQRRYAEQPRVANTVRGRDGNRPQRLGGLKDVQRIIGQRDLHEVIVALPATHHAQILSIIDNCRQYGVDFKLVPDLFEMRFNEVRIDALNGVPLIGVKDLRSRAST